MIPPRNVSMQMHFRKNPGGSLSSINHLDIIIIAIT